MHFSKKSGRLSSEGPDVLAFGSHCLAKFQPILNCFIPKFKLKYEDSENIKTDCADSHFQITSNQTEKVFFWDTRYFYMSFIHCLVYYFVT